MMVQKARERKGMAAILVWNFLLFQVIFFVSNLQKAETAFHDLDSIQQSVLRHCNDALMSSCPAKCRCCDNITNSSLSSLEIAIDSSKSAVICTKSSLTEFPFSLPSNTNIFIAEFNYFEYLNTTLSAANGNNSTEYRFQYVSLRNNDIVNIIDKFFQNFTYLETLILSDNDISDLTWSKELWKAPLVTLDLSFNKITQITNITFGTLKHLKRLILSHNSIGSVGPSAFEPVFQVEFLDLSSNHLHVDGIYENSFSDLQQLSHLSLAGNQKLTKLPLFKYIGMDRAKLETLDLHDLPFLQFVQPQVFYALENLITLNLSHCGIEELMLGWLDGGPQNSLKTLDLSYNKFVEIRDYFFVSTEIDNFCSYNVEAKNFSYAPPATRYRQFYRNLHHMSWLSLRNNYKLRSFENDAFNFLPELQYLFLQKCNISKLNLASYTFQYHEDALRETFDNLRGLWIYDNPLYCDCRVGNVIDESLSYSGSNKNFRITDCESARKFWSNKSLFVDVAVYFYEGRCQIVQDVALSYCFPFYNSERIPLSDVPRSYLRCPEEPIALFVAMIIGPLAFVASIATMLLCGLCKVFMTRFHRSYIAMYHPKYYLMAARSERALAAQNSSSSFYNSSNSRNGPRQKIRSSSTSGKFHQKLQFGQFRTNIVLSSMNSLRSSQNELPLLEPPHSRKNKRSSITSPSSRGPTSRKRGYDLWNSTAVNEAPPRYHTLDSQAHCLDMLSTNSRMDVDKETSLSITDRFGSNSSLNSQAKHDVPPIKNRPLPTINPPQENDSQTNEYQKLSSCKNSLLCFIDDDDASQKSETEFFVPKTGHGSSSPQRNAPTGIRDKPPFRTDRCDPNIVSNTQRRREHLLKTSAFKLRDAERDYYSS